jgi:hypothetical protein
VSSKTDLISPPDWIEVKPEPPNRSMVLVQSSKPFWSAPMTSPRGVEGETMISARVRALAPSAAARGSSFSQISAMVLSRASRTSFSSTRPT